MQMALSSERFSMYLNSLVSPKSSVVIWATNCWQWAISDLGIQLSGCVSVPVYPTAGEDQLTYIFNDAAPEVVIVDHLTKSRLDILRKIEGLKKVIVFGDIEERPGDGLVIEFNDALDANQCDQLNSKLWQQDRLGDPFTKLTHRERQAFQRRFH